MTRTYLLTGSASGIGAATAARLRDEGHRVISVDRRDADIAVDLATEAGRAELVAAATALAPDGLDGVLAGAGLADWTRPREVVAVNHFGAVATLSGLRPLLARRPSSRAVAICSTAALLPADDAALVACLEDDETAALAAAEANPAAAYMSSKRALALWLRRTAVTAPWAGAGILLNAIAPGVVVTPMVEPLLVQPDMVRAMAQSNPIAVEGYAAADEMAEMIAFLLGFRGHYLVGQVIFNDGGTDALTRPDRF